MFHERGIFINEDRGERMNLSTLFQIMGGVLVSDAISVRMRSPAKS